jgi:hypothetical protein
MKEKTMKLKTINLILIAILLLNMIACNSNQGVLENEITLISGPVLKVGDKTFDIEDLENMPKVESSFEDVVYIGVPVSELLLLAGISLENIKAIKAVASDGYTMHYESNQLNNENNIVAYRQKDGPLSGDEGNFRMVFPGEAGSMNLRMLIELSPVE